MSSTKPLILFMDETLWRILKEGKSKEAPVYTDTDYAHRQGADPLVVLSVVEPAESAQPEAVSASIVVSSDEVFVRRNCYSIDKRDIGFGLLCLAEGRKREREEMMNHAITDAKVLAHMLQREEAAAREALEIMCDTWGDIVEMFDKHAIEKTMQRWKAARQK